MKELEKLLSKVEKPARYINREWNSVYKNSESVEAAMVFAFPDLYEVGMSHLGMHILYNTINARNDALMERVFAPWLDMEELMRKNNMSLFSLESQTPLKDFDLVGFTLQYEMSYTNVLNMLDLAGFPLYSGERDGDYPLVMAGGPCAFNPEPLAPFIDVFVIGEGEDVLHEILDAYIAEKRKGSAKGEILKVLAGIEGVYIPSFYKFFYFSNESVRVVEKDPCAPGKVKKRCVKNLDWADYPVSPLVPHTGVVHDRIMLEVMRGCTRGCRFCQAGIIYRPVREKSPEILLQQAEKLVRNTGWEEISLTSLSSSDYSRVSEVAGQLVERFKNEMINVSLPSLRADAFSVGLAREVQKVRRSSLTFAPEAGTQRLRNVINKGVTEENLMEAVTSAFESGWTAVKLYFMLGLPGETGEDVEGIEQVAKNVLQKGREISSKKGRVKVTVSASSFVPKPHTPFQWEVFCSLEELGNKQSYLKKKLKGKGLVFNWHKNETSLLEADFARGSRNASRVLEKAWRRGCRFDGWSECFDYKKWEKAFQDCGMNPGHFAFRNYDYGDVLPWDHIDTGINKKFLIQEHKKALEEITTPDCRHDKCTGCGICPNLEIKPELAGGEEVVPVQDTL